MTKEPTNAHSDLDDCSCSDCGMCRPSDPVRPEPKALSRRFWVGVAISVGSFAALVVLSWPKAPNTYCVKWQDVDGFKSCVEFRSKRT